MGFDKILKSFFAEGALFASIAGIVIYILLIVAYWKIFEKAGEKGWKSIIPFYNIYIEFKIAWDKKFFWMAIILSAIFSICSASDSNILNFIGFIPSFVTAIIVLIENFKLCKSFGHGFLFGLLNLFLPNIGRLILGYSSNKYIGPSK